jgi:transposase
VIYSIRIDRTNPAALRVQVVKYVKRRPVVLKHIGTAYTDEDLLLLKTVAQQWIEKNHPQSRLFPVHTTPQPLLTTAFNYQGFRYTYAYEWLDRICTHLAFTDVISRMMSDFVIIRVFEPASKLRSIAHLSNYFCIEYTEKALYKELPKLPKLKEQIEQKLVTIAQSEFGFDFSFVLYDVTTLYFETFVSDTLRKPGFSKDNKSQQPQIVVGLMVTQEGFPVSYEVFAGNTFEGKTFLPSILAFKQRNDIKTLTVVADAAMLSVDNMKLLVENKLTYIVGARLGNIPAELLSRIDTTLIRTNGQTMHTHAQYGTLVCSFSKKRFTKDQSEMNKQILKAEAQIATPSKLKRTKFVSTSQDTVLLNDELIAKTKKLLGVKGYYTNLVDTSDSDIIAHYHSLWNVEQAFRIAKSDVVSRPIFHRKEESIRAHMLICVMALAISKYIELKAGQSIRSVLDALKQVTDAIIVHRATGIPYVMRSAVSPELMGITKKMTDLSH